MSNETVVKKVPFDILEVGCKYESRCGEIWEVTGIADDQSPLTHNASNLDDEDVSSIFTETGKFWSSMSSPHDLVFKLVGVSSGEVKEKPKHETEDKGKHYRHSFKLRISQEDLANGYVTVNLDPYRISDVYELGGWREHVVKKALRGTLKGHSEQELIDELRACIDRAEQMMKEDWKENE